jgi:hypothetical protein
MPGGGSCWVPVLPAREAVARRLGVDERRWEEIERACGVGVVPLGVGVVG